MRSCCHTCLRLRQTADIEARPSAASLRPACFLFFEAPCSFRAQREAAALCQHTLRLPPPQVLCAVDDGGRRPLGRQARRPPCRCARRCHRRRGASAGARRPPQGRVKRQPARCDAAAAGDWTGRCRGTAERAGRGNFTPHRACPAACHRRCWRCAPPPSSAWYFAPCHPTLLPAAPAAVPPQRRIQLQRGGGGRAAASYSCLSP